MSSFQPFSSQSPPSSSQSSEAEGENESSSSEAGGEVLRKKTAKRSRHELEQFYQSYQTAFAESAVSLRAFHQEYPQRIRPAYSTACKFRAGKFRSPDAEPPRVGRPSELTDADNLEVARRLETLIRQHGGGVITNNVIAGEALDVARIPRLGEGPNSPGIFDRCKRVGGYYWCKSFRQKYGFTETRVKRPIEIERAMKCQPEFMLLQYRNLAHVYALMMIHRAIARGQVVEGWVLNSGWVVREGGPHVGTNTPLAESSQ